MPVERLTRSSFPELLPVSAPAPLAVLPTRIWTDEQWRRIELGYSAADMDEKWDVFCEGDVVYLHRSWTGHGIFEVAFVPVRGGGRQIVGAMVETDPDRYACASDATSAVTLELVISAVVLGEDAADLRARLVGSAVSKGSVAQGSPGAALHSVLGLRSGT